MGVLNNEKEIRDWASKNNYDYYMDGDDYIISLKSRTTGMKSDFSYRIRKVNGIFSIVGYGFKDSIPGVRQDALDGISL